MLSFRKSAFKLPYTTSWLKRRKAACGQGNQRQPEGKVLTLESMNQNVRKMKFAIRGALEVRAGEIAKEIEKGVKKPFKQIVLANIGDCQAMGQKPLTYYRQVMAACVKPDLMCRDNMLPPDVIMRAREALTAASGHSISCYTPPQGIELFRRDVAGYIEQRDGHECDYENVFLSNGASTAIADVLRLFAYEAAGKKSGIMLPIPVFPLYTACCAEFGLQQCPYYLDEDNDWALNVKELERCHHENSKKALIRAIVVINPGNPTGQVLTKKNIENILKFAHERNLVVLADEVYQENVYAADAKFHAFKKVLMDNKSISNEVELASFMTTSKGFFGECGIRGGWCELTNFDPRVRAQLYKTGEVNECSTSIGQLVAGLIARPPQKGDPSYATFAKERQEILGSLKVRAELVVKTFNAMKGFRCNTVKGAMYAFPRITLPPKAIEAAKQEHKSPDTFYIFKLLEATGIAVVPGSGFGQRPGTYHFRTTILPPIKLLNQVMGTFKDFHDKFTKQYT